MNYQECRDCCKELCNREPADLFEAYTIASAYIATDERIRVHYPSARGEPASSSRRAMQVDGMKDLRGRGQRNFPTDQRAVPRQIREEPNFTPLTQTPSYILQQIRTQDFFQVPNPMRTPTEKRDRTRLCDYHARIGHNTDECTSLKYFLERLVKRGLLNDYLLPRDRLNPPRLEGAARAAPPRHVVDMIVGGNVTSCEIMQINPPLQAFRLIGTSISFSDADYPRGNVCRNGPIIVTLDMVNQDVKKVLVDNCSSVDIIFKHALRRMILNTPLEDVKLEEVHGPVYDFGNYVVPVQGAIDIPTTFGTSPQEVTSMVKYYVIDMASPYNSIIGQPPLFFLGAIISSPHMKVKFPTPMGPGELITDFVASQYCFSATLSLA
ncbi:uncharacterized protein LOC141686255 [Apium graveolens]|uniref:uncharacterized protein LOC141686255 n=1 Tax=Apium graveolens TaxID=4045 RepID=UPI003D797BD5